MGLCVDTCQCVRGTQGLHVQGSRVVRKLSSPYTGMNLHTVCSELHAIFNVRRGAHSQE